MTLLRREIAPIQPEAWEAIDEEARSVLKVRLAARKLVDVEGPHGWDFGAVNTGKLELLENDSAPNVGAGVRQMQPLVELRTPFQLELMELDSISRGLESPNLDPLVDAAERMAEAENRMVFKGFAAGKIQGMLEAGEHDPVPFGGTIEERFAAIVQAWQVLQHAGVDGPYGLAVTKDIHSAILQAVGDGYPMVKRIRDLIKGPIVRADELDGAVLVSMRGGDFRLTLGQDIAIGYAFSDHEKAELYLTSSFTFQTLDGAALVELSPS